MPRLLLRPTIYVFLIFAFFSCQKDFSVSYATSALKFSKDTVFLDTIFKNIGSSTYRLKVYNQEDNWVKIPRIKLGQGDNSNYRINIDGISSNNLENVEIPPKDSIYIFIETTVPNITTDEFLYVDSIVFETKSNIQDVKLVTLVKDAKFLFPNKGESLFIIEDELWTNDKPYVIYGYGVVNSSKSLYIQPKSRIHFHNNSGLIVYEDASLTVGGKLGEEVIFEGDRLEPYLKDTPGQWGMIWLYPTSKNNIIDYAIIKNGTIGLRVDSIGNSSNPTLKITNTQIYNQSIIGLQARGSYIYGENVVINNCGEVSLALQIGGKYNFKHSTIVNYWSNHRETPSVYISNWYKAEDGRIISRNLDEAFFGNCIIYGNNEDELFLSEDGGAIFNYKFENNLVKYTNRKGELGYEIDGNDNFVNTIINEEPSFWDQYINDLRIDEKSSAIGKGALNIANTVPLDILQITRNTANKVDIGAYQNIAR